MRWRVSKSLFLGHKQRYEELLALHVANRQRLHQRLWDQQRVLLAINRLQLSEKRHLTRYKSGSSARAGGSGSTVESAGMTRTAY